MPDFSVRLPLVERLLEEQDGWRLAQRAQAATTHALAGGAPPKVSKQSTIQRAISAMEKEVKKEGRKKKTHKVDQAFPHASNAQARHTSS